MEVEVDQPYRKSRLAAFFKLSRFSLCLSLAILLFWGAAPLLHAYDKNQYARALRFKICIKCDLYKANFSGVDLSYADFTGSNLILASFQKATLYQANFENANLSGANFEGAMWINGVICQGNSYGKCNFPEQK
ncbi:MAG: pentapeptide repeat-containing protein [Deltaproteobacteria bacterium]|mgnify:FL=1|nr:pentapeptide repeat-containing protein [Deltaproteobacteria bacterium]MBT4264877.1 pentapeptide repeat-containing protein [Deltaproteobacteria bacterium]MBT4640037.1 pentapeptide repeat-containing protein [Deltaproteobacteria bacterium]MBT6610516.1 pentapeptide repeat-containing protein [Deltaproteobacteria bacterium]MBT7153190.1 pentapeptide repeat-containing protein [Deltaproteobacteria bacterium]